MKKYIILALVLTSQIACMAQSVQNCYVKEYNDKKAKTPLANVEIVARNAGSAVSGKKGEFQLSFRTLKPGDKVELIKASKEKYEIFNIDAVNEWRIANDGTPFTIVMCKSAKFKALKDQYNATASESYARQKKHDEAELKRQLNEGKMKAEEYESRLEALQQEYEDRLGNLENYVDKFARIDLSELSAEEQKIVELVQAGKIDEAVEAYKKMNIVGKIEKIGKEKAEVDKAIAALQLKSNEMNEEQQKLLAMMKNEISVLCIKGGEESFERITTLWVNAAEALKTAEVYSMVHLHLVSMHRYEESLPYGAKALNMFDENSSKFAETSLSMAQAFYLMGEVDSALKYNQTAKESIEKYISKSSFEYLDLYTGILNLYGTYYRDMMMYDDAEKMFIEEFKLYDLGDSLDIDEETLFQKRFSSIVNLATTYVEMGDYNKALKTALPLYEKTRILAANDKFPIVDFCVLQMCVGNSYRLLERYDSALIVFEQGRSQMEQSYKHNPRMAVEQYADFINNIGVVYYSQGKYIEALAKFEEAMAYSKEACSYGKIVEAQSAYAMLLNNTGYLAWIMKDYVKAEKYFLEAYDLREKLCKQNYGANILEANRVHINMMSLYLSMGNMDKCATFDSVCVKEADFIYGILADAYQVNYLLTYCNHGEYLARTGKADEALKVWNMILSKDPQYAENHPESSFVEYIMKQNK